MRSGASAVPRGTFLTFEGGEGSGKSTQLRLLAERIRASGHDVVETREPGGTPGAEALRHVLLAGGAEVFGPFGEAVLFAAARADHVGSFIKPRLRSGTHVLCDRFIDSSRAYQTQAGPGLRHLERAAVAGTRPDITFIFDIPPRIGVARVLERDSSLDRFEQSRVEEQERRRAAFIAIAAREPDRCVVIDAEGTIEEVTRRVDRALVERAPHLLEHQPAADIA